jgi:uroporphyrinogen decarboxylase
LNAFNPILKKPNPDFDSLVRVLAGEEEATRVHLMELVLDAEIMQAITEQYLDQKWIPDTEETKEAYIQQTAELFYRLGFDFAVEGVWRSIWKNHPSLQSPSTEDTAGKFSRGIREWANEGRGLITSWETLEQFPWEKITVDYRPYELLARSLPEGMKIVVSSSFFEHVLENLLGYEGLFYLMYDDPDLVAEVFYRWGQKVYDYYKKVVTMDRMGAVFHADDLGFKTSVLLPDIHIDGFHSFENVIIDPKVFKKNYGERVAMLGGMDMDNLCQMSEDTLRSTIRELLGNCMPRRFALGTGNTVANYVPLNNYLVLLDEARRWSTGPH